MKTTKEEKEFQMKYEKKGYKCIRKGYPDFIFYKEDKKGNILEVRFIEHKKNNDCLSNEQKIFKRIAEFLNLNYNLFRGVYPINHGSKFNETTIGVSNKTKKKLDKLKCYPRQTYDDLISQLIDMVNNIGKKKWGRGYDLGTGTNTVTNREGAE